MSSKYNLDKIKFSVDQATFDRAINLYEGEKIKNFKEESRDYTAFVSGTKSYRVKVDKSDFCLADCECYLGQRDILCKHIIAVALYSIFKGKSIDKKDKEIKNVPECSEKIKEINKVELSIIKKDIANAVRYIKSYNGPSSTWFRYQDSLSEGCLRLSKIISELPVNKDISDLLVNVLLKLDKKLSFGGVDDSDGTVGNFMDEVVKVLEKYVELDKNCKKSFKKLLNQETCFGWEESLLKIYDK